MTKKSILNNDGDSSLVYCRKCTQKKKKEDEFYQATDLFLDTNGRMSICKSCINDIYAHYYNQSHSVDDAILKTCRAVNVIYIQSSVDALKTHIENKLNDKKDIVNPFGIYKRMLSPHARGLNSATSDNLTFTEPNVLTVISQEEVISSLGSQEQYDELSIKWGSGLPVTDYEFLERELADWKKTHKCDNKSEELLLKEICWKQLVIKQVRENGGTTAALVKELQELMKTAAVDPAKANAASGGNSADAFGVWIKDIENKTPAEWWKDQTLFKDMDNIGVYAREFITEPIRKFILGNMREYSGDNSQENNSEEGGENVTV